MTTEPQSLVARLLTLLVSLSALLACTPVDKGELWTMVAASPQGLDSLHRASKDFLILEGKRSYRMECFLQHDNRTDEEAIDLRLLVLHKDDTLYNEAIHLPLAQKQGVWLGQGFLNHEVSFAPSKALTLPYPGIYRWELYSPSKVSPKGITLVGFRLK